MPLSDITCVYTPPASPDIDLFFDTDSYEIDLNFGDGSRRTSSKISTEIIQKENGEFSKEWSHNTAQTSAQSISHDVENKLGGITSTIHTFQLHAAIAMVLGNSKILPDHCIAFPYKFDPDEPNEKLLGQLKICSWCGCIDITSDGASPSMCDHCPAENPKLCEEGNITYAIGPLAVLWISNADHFCWKLIKERLYGCFSASHNLLLMLHIDDEHIYHKNPELETWMIQHDTFQVIVVIYNSNKLYDISQIPLVKTHKSVTGVLSLLDFGHETVLKSYQTLIVKGFVKWIVGFSNPTINVEQYLSFIPEFIVQASLGYQLGRQNRALDSIGLSLLAPPLCFMTGVFLIQLRGPRRTVPSLFSISVKMPSSPWGLSLADCPRCRCNWYMKTDQCDNGPSTDVTCYGCSSSGTAERPQNWEIQLVSLGISQQVWIGTLPQPASIIINWKTTSGIVSQKQPRSDVKIHASCSSCNAISDCIGCSYDTSCAYALCTGVDRCCLTQPEGETASWICPRHALEIRPPYPNFTINCDMWHLEDAVPIGQTLIVDMLEEPSPVSIAVERFSKKFDTDITMVKYPTHPDDPKIIVPWVRRTRTAQTVSVLVILQGNSVFANWEERCSFIRKVVDSIPSQKAVYCGALCLMLDEECVNWGPQSQSVEKGIFDFTISLFMSEFGSFILNEIYEELILAMLKHPKGDSFTQIRLWRRPLVLKLVSAVLTAREGTQISRFAVFKASPLRPLGHIPSQCSVCRVPIHLSCSTCEESIKEVI